MNIFEWIVIIILASWLFGFGLHIGGSFIHALLFIAFIVYLISLRKRNKK